MGIKAKLQDRKNIKKKTPKLLGIAFSNMNKMEK